MKSRILAFCLALFFLFLAGCGKTANYGKSNDGYVAEEEVRGSDDQAPGTNFEKSVKKIIKDGTMYLETKDVDKAYADILSHAKQNGGYEFSHEKSVRDEYV